jgi:hypothetical protein
MDRPIFIHIPKTGGLTMSQVILRNVDRKRALVVVDSHKSLMRKFAALPQHERDQYVAALGHLRYGVHRFFSSGTPRYFTMLRHPIERTLSAYSYSLERRRRNPNKVGIANFVEFISDVRQGQKQAEWLMGYAPGAEPTLAFYGREFDLPVDAVETLKQRLTDEFVLVGVLERFDASLLMLQDSFGWQDVHYERANATRKRLRYTDLNAEEKRVLDALTGPDFELYDWVRKQLDAKIEALGDPFQERLSKFQKQNENYVDRGRQITQLQAKFHPKRLIKAALRRLRG